MSREDFFTVEEIRKLKRITLDELRELTRNLDALLLQLRAPSEAGEAAARLNRIFHTVGGSAAIAGFEEISEAGCALETMTGELAGKNPPPPGLIEQIAEMAARLARNLAEKEAEET